MFHAKFGVNHTPYRLQCSHHLLRHILLYNETTTSTAYMEGERGREGGREGERERGREGERERENERERVRDDGMIRVRVVQKMEREEIRRD